MSVTCRKVCRTASPFSVAVQPVSTTSRQASPTWGTSASLLPVTVMTREFGATSRSSASASRGYRGHHRADQTQRMTVTAAISRQTDAAYAPVASRHRLEQTVL